MLIGIAPKLTQLRRDIAARGWTPAEVEYVDHGVSGAKTKRTGAKGRETTSAARKNGWSPSPDVGAATLLSGHPTAVPGTVAHKWAETA